jgi:hypothetical protein
VRELSPDARMFAVGIVGIFTFLLLVSFLYEWRKGALDWEDPVEPRRLKPEPAPVLNAPQPEPVAALTGENR